MVSSNVGRTVGYCPGRYDCRETRPRHPVDMTHIPICPRAADPLTTKPPNCGCPGNQEEQCWKCCMPGVIETKMLRHPVQCVKPCCDYCIPAIPCRDPPKSPKIKCTPHCFDYTVDEPGPNDSYGLKGLNWYDWQMEGRFSEELRGDSKNYKPAHPGFSKNLPYGDFPTYMCRRPIECYSREESPCKKSPFAREVNYFRDWRCCEAKQEPAWRPPYKQWATRVDL